MKNTETDLLSFFPVVVWAHVSFYLLTVETAP